MQPSPRHRQCKMAFELFVTLYRSSDNTTEEKVVTFSSPPETVGDLKVAVESQHNVPRCLQTIEIGDRYIKTDDDRLSDHYVTAGDRFKVTYLYESNVKFARNFTECVMKMKEQLIELLPKRARSVPYHPYNTLCTMLSSISYGYFSPWLSDQTAANRKCFVQVGALDAVLSLQSYLQANYPWNERVKKLQALEERILSFLWNMAETTESQEPVISRGGIQLILRALKCVDVSDFVKYQNLFKYAAGCISNYCETKSCQLLLAPDTNALNQMLKFVLVGPSSSFNNIIIANCFFRMSRSLETHCHLSSPGILGQILEFTDKCLKISSGEDDASTTIYALLMAVGRILMLTTLTCVTVPVEYVKQMENLTQRFLELANMEGMRSLQEEYSNNWNSLVPFIEPILSPEHTCCHFNQDIIKELFFFSLNLELPRKRLLQVARSEGLLEYLTCLQWYAPADNIKSSFVDTLSTTQLIEVPRLGTIVRAKIAVVSRLGFLSIQQQANNIVRQLMINTQTSL